MNDSRSAASSQIVVGILLIALGLGITAITYDNASGGGTYIVAWGPVVYGVISLFRGLLSIGRD